MAFTMAVADLIATDTSGLLSKHDNWLRVRLGDIATVLNGAPFESSLFSTVGGMPLVRIRDVIKGNTSTYYTGGFDSNYVVEPADLLVGMDGDFNSGYWRGPKALLNQRVCKVAPIENFYDKRFLAYVLPSYLAAINANTPSTTVKHLSSKTIGEIPLPLPGLKEQARIAEKLDELFSDLDAGVTELIAARKKLAHYRQSILKAAIEGTLTTEWRERNTVRESGSQLLARILVERRKRWEANQAAKFSEQNRVPPKGWENKYVEPPGSDEAVDTNVPSGWTRATVLQLGEVQLGRQRTPDKVTGTDPTKYIRAANITEKGFDLVDVLQMDFSPDERNVFALKPGDVLLTEASGSPEHVGRPAIWKDVKELYCFQNTVIRFSPNGISSEFAFWMFLAWQKLGKFQKVAGGIGINHLSAGKFSRISLPLPSLSEQQEIVRLLSSAWERSSSHERAIEFSLKQAVAQRRGILKTAVTGKLVPQDVLDDQPASLLKKIEMHLESQKARPITPKRKKAKKVRKLDAEALCEWINSHANDSFSFADIRATFPQSYDTLKAALFEVLAKTEPIIEQCFNANNECLRFKKIR
jgi:type I restriction enzyme S subunit